MQVSFSSGHRTFLLVCKFSKGSISITKKNMQFPFRYLTLSPTPLMFRQKITRSTSPHYAQKWPLAGHKSQTNLTTFVHSDFFFLFLFFFLSIPLYAKNMRMLKKNPKSDVGQCKEEELLCIMKTMSKYYVIIKCINNSLGGLYTCEINTGRAILGIFFPWPPFPKPKPKH